MAGEELVLVDPLDDRERGWLAGAAAKGAAVNVGDGASTLLADLREVQPTWFRAHPEVWQQLRDEVERRAGDAPWLGRSAYRRRLLVRRSVRRWLGLARVRRAQSTGSLDPAIVAWFRGLGIVIDVEDGIDG
jgi:long-subunit acyl-CoA synthetase (AMP-forming)